MDVADLAALPRGRAVLFSSGNQPALLRPVLWMDTSTAALVEDSLSRYEPGERKQDRLRDTASFSADLAAAGKDGPMLPTVVDSMEKAGLLL